MDKAKEASVSLLTQGMLQLKFYPPENFGFVEGEPETINGRNNSICLGYGKAKTVVWVLHYGNPKDVRSLGKTNHHKYTQMLESAHFQNNPHLLILKM